MVHYSHTLNEKKHMENSFHGVFLKQFLLDKWAHSNLDLNIVNTYFLSCSPSVFSTVIKKFNHVRKEGPAYFHALGALRRISK